jgi:hypothetical protein
MRRFNAGKFGRAGLCVMLGLASWQPIIRADDGSTNSEQRIDRLEEENRELRDRLDRIEAKETNTTGSAAAGLPGALNLLSQMQVSGYITASYFYDSPTPGPGGTVSDGLSFTRYHDSFTLNAVSLTLQKLVKNNGEDWDIGYRVELIYGANAPDVDNVPDFHYAGIREAYMDVNIPVGNGLDFRAGQLISLLNFESGDQVLNPNFSQGNQWYFTGNPPDTGVQLGYNINDQIDVKVRLQNGLYSGVIANSSGKTLMGRIGFRPDDKTSIALFGFGGPQGANDTHDWTDGSSLIATRDLTSQLHAATEIDYFHAQGGNPITGGDAQWWSGGGWLWYDFTKKVDLAFRGDYVDDVNGGGTSGLLGFPTNAGQEIYSFTRTLNLTQHTKFATFQFRPEIRYDHTTLAEGFNGHNERVSAGVGVGMMF